MGFIKMISGSVLAVFFIIAIIMFAVNFAGDNDSQVSILNDSSNTYVTLNSTLQSNLETYRGDANTSSNILFKTVLESGDEHASSGGQFKVGPIGALGMATQSFTAAFDNLFGVEFRVFLISAIALLTTILFYYTIKAWLGRDPD